MPNWIDQYFHDHIALAQQAAGLAPQIDRIGRLLCTAFSTGNKLLTFGNGGSACDANHFAEEMVGRFKRTRRPLPAIALTTDGAALTCIANDYSFADIFARQVTALAVKNDIVIGISTSGNSENVLRALIAAKEKGAVTVALLGNAGGKAAPLADHALIVESNVASLIQEMHICIIHLLCEAVDQWAVE